jgi:two-component system, OmpR family, response regulator
MMGQRSTPLRVLVIEDDSETADYIARSLSEEGHAVDRSLEGGEGLKIAATSDYDVLVIDRMLPGLDGLTLVKTLRQSGVSSPVLFVTSLGGIDDRVEGLEAGGDDYLVKPFARAELIARVHALGRRTALRQEETVLRVADLEMNLISRTVTRGGQQIELQPREFKLLEILLRHKERVLTRSMLLEYVWDFHFDPKTSIVETHISRVRAKVDRPFDLPLIQTVRGVGYSVNEPQ